MVFFSEKTRLFHSFVLYVFIVYCKKQHLFLFSRHVFSRQPQQLNLLMILSPHNLNLCTCEIKFSSLTDKPQSLLALHVEHHTMKVPACI